MSSRRKEKERKKNSSLHKKDNVCSVLDFSLILRESLRREERDREGRKEERQRGKGEKDE